MSESTQSFGKNINYLRHAITLGYLSLLVIGFIVDSITYSNLGIDILHYSSVFDLLVSPIATMISSRQILPKQLSIFSSFFSTK